jgi:hypothetical protein
LLNPLADVFAGYAELYRSGRIRAAACMAHARRKLHDLQAVRPSLVTTEAPERIGALYRIEEYIRRNPLDERRHIRQTHAVPLLDDLKQWFEAILLKLSAKLGLPRNVAPLLPASARVSPISTRLIYCLQITLVASTYMDPDAKVDYGVTPQQGDTAYR